LDSAKSTHSQKVLAFLPKKVQMCFVDQKVIKADLSKLFEMAIQKFN
jgi:hypothetical protein